MMFDPAFQRLLQDMDYRPAALRPPQVSPPAPVAPTPPVNRSISALEALQQAIRCNRPQEVGSELDENCSQSIEDIVVASSATNAVAHAPVVAVAPASVLVQASGVGPVPLRPLAEARVITHASTALEEAAAPVVQVQAAVSSISSTVNDNDWMSAQVFRARLPGRRGQGQLAMTAQPPPAKQMRKGPSPHATQTSTAPSALPYSPAPTLALDASPAETTCISSPDFDPSTSRNEFEVDECVEIELVDEDIPAECLVSDVDPPNVVPQRRESIRLLAARLRTPMSTPPQAREEAEQEPALDAAPPRTRQSKRKIKEVSASVQAPPVRVAASVTAPIQHETRKASSRNDELATSTRRVSTCIEQGCSNIAALDQRCHQCRAKLCPHVGCTRLRQLSGFCRRHGGALQCSVTGCESSVRSGGLCQDHSVDACSADGDQPSAREVRAKRRQGNLTLAKQTDGAHQPHSTGGDPRPAPGIHTHDESSKGPSTEPRTCMEDGCPKIAREDKNDRCEDHREIVQCRYDGPDGACLRLPQRHGFCQQHGGVAICKSPNCDSRVRRAEFCRRHLPEATDTGTRTNARSSATSARVKASSVPNTHTTKVHDTGKSRRNYRPCIVDGCNAKVWVSERCTAHGGRLCRYDGPGGCTRRQQQFGFCWRHGGGPKKCSIPNCNKSQRRNNLCDHHLSVEAPAADDQYTA